MAQLALLCDTSVICNVAGILECVQELLGPAGALPVLVLASGADECVPQGTNIPALTKKITSAMGINASLELLEGAQHNLQGHEHLCALLVGQFLEHINPV